MVMEELWWRRRAEEEVDMVTDEIDLVGEV